MTVQTTPVAPSPVAVAIARIVDGWMWQIAAAAHRCAEGIHDGALTLDASDDVAEAYLRGRDADAAFTWADEGLAALRNLAAGDVYDDDTLDAPDSAFGEACIAVHPVEDLAGTGLTVRTLHEALVALTPAELADAYLAR